jgi:predicted MFS family arabinose efflux permease
VRLIGGPLGGVLLAAYGIRTLICADVLSYLVSAAAMLMTSRRASLGESPDASQRTTIRAIGRDLREGLRELRARPVAQALLPVTVIFLAANASLSAVLIPFGVQHLGGSRQTGVVFAALGIGFLLGAPALRALLDRFPTRYLLTASLAATALAYSLLFRSSSLATALPAAIAVGAFGSMSLVIPQTAVQRVVPGAVLGRVTAVFLTGEAAATLAGAVIGPILGQAVQYSGVAGAATLTTLVAAALAWTLL